MVYSGNGVFWQLGLYICTVNFMSNTIFVLYIAFWGNIWYELDGCEPLISIRLKKKLIYIITQTSLLEFALIWWKKPSGISYLHLHQDWVITDLLWYIICVSDSVGPWLPWSQWSMCSVSCGGGQQHRSRICSLPPCSSLSRQSKTCNTQVCLGKSRFALGGDSYCFDFTFIIRLMAKL